jgi:hypothetical protein
MALYNLWSWNIKESKDQSNLSVYNYNESNSI